MRTSLVLVSSLGVVQALFLALAFVVRRVNRRADRALAALLLAMAIYLGGGAYQAADLVSWWPTFLGWAHPMPLLFGPLLYLYARYATDADLPMRWRDAWHLAPAGAVIAWALPVYLLPAGDKVALYESMRRGVTPPNVALLLGVSGWLKIASGAVYTMVTVRLTRAHRNAVRQQYSTLDRITLDWLLTLVVASAIVWSVAIGARFIEPAGLVPPGTGDQLIVVLMVVATYAIGYRGMQQSAVVPLASATPAAVLAPLDAGEPALLEASSGRSSLTPGMASAIEHRLRTTMRDAEPWRSAELTLGDLAQLVGTTTHKLSEVLNTRVQQSFHDYVNGFRVHEVQRQLARPESASRTLLAIAQDAGFASKSTFNSVFRRVAGMTPSQWRAERTAADAAASAGEQSSEAAHRRPRPHPMGSLHVPSDPTGRPAR